MEAALEVTIFGSKFLAFIFWRKSLNQQIICFAMKVIKARLLLSRGCNSLGISKTILF